jgi:hypothetical protein
MVASHRREGNVPGRTTFCPKGQAGRAGGDGSSGQRRLRPEMMWPLIGISAVPAAVT